MAAVPGLIGIPGINVAFWSTVGLLRFFQEEVIWPKKLTKSEKKLAWWMRRKVVAVCIAARNEEKAMGRTIRSLRNQVGLKNIYVASDGSTDQTVQVAKSFRVNVLDLHPNRGKAGALLNLIQHFDLFQKYLFILFVDADTHIDKDYLRRALPLFADPQVVAVAGHGITQWRKHLKPQLKMFFVAYRDRLYNFLQYTIRYGQTAKWLNVSPIVPGFASTYRVSALKKIDITTGGLVIEDFNMTFQIHRKSLGKIAYHPRIFGIAKDPTNLADYFRQVKRWNLGFFQTVGKYGLWPSLFTIALSAFILESMLAAGFFVILPFIIIILALQVLPGEIFEFFRQNFIFLNAYISLIDLLLVLVVADYLITIMVAAAVKRPMLLFYGLGFPILRVIDAFAIFVSLFQAVFVKSQGSWIPAKR